MQVRTLLAAGALFAASTIAADRIAVSLAEFTDQEHVAGNTFQTSTIATPNGLTGSAVCVLSVSRSNQLSWDPATNAAEYRVERAVGNGAFSVLATTTLPSYNDGAVSDGTYRYRVAGKRSHWTSPVSNVLTLTQPTLCV